MRALLWNAKAPSNLSLTVAVNWTKTVIQATILELFCPSLTPDLQRPVRPWLDVLFNATIALAIIV
jgi:hypothetical protein